MQTKKERCEEMCILRGRVAIGALINGHSAAWRPLCVTAANKSILTGLLLIWSHFLRTNDDYIMFRRPLQEGIGRDFIIHDHCLPAFGVPL